MAHDIDRIIALWAWLEPHIFRHPGWVTFWLGLTMLVVWRIARSYVKFIAREVRPKPAPDPTNFREALAEINERVEHLNRVMAAHDHPVESIWPDPAALRPGMVLIWNGRAWVGHPTTPANPEAVIVRKSRGKGKKTAIEIDRPPTAWERIAEDADGGSNQTR